MNRWPIAALALIGLLFVVSQAATPASAQNAQVRNAQAQNALEDVFKKTLDDLLGGGKKRGNGQERAEKVPGSKAEIDLKPGEGIKGSALSLTADVPGIDPAKFDELANKAKAECPVSKALGAIAVTLEAKLA